MNYLRVLTPFLSKVTADKTVTSAFKAFGETFCLDFQGTLKKDSRFSLKTFGIFVAYHTTRCHFTEFSDYCFTIPRTSNLTSGTTAVK